MTTSPSRTLPRIAMVGTGGTIAGAGTASNGLPSAAYQAAVVSASDLISHVPQLARLAELQVEQLLQIDSADFTDDKLLRLARRVAALCARDDVDGVVVTHGTDTMEESAYFLHLTVKSPKPIVLTGAMRPGTALAADGPANLLHAVAVASHPGSSGRGVLVVMNEEIHSARDVAKVHAMRLDAFASPHGPLGLVAEETPRWYRALTRPHTTQSEFDITAIDTLPLVGVVSSHGNMRQEIYEAWVALGARAIVHAGFGGGTVPAYLADYLSMLRARGVLLVRASRTGAGPVIRNANADDDAQGWVVTDDQNPPRARLLAALALAHHDSPEALQQVFWRY
ncbi:MAG: asparaginase [Ottowia sp.]|uniref:asparaginase n=1 Tax=Ottowia sp. TaxID=1898956 RepID=UPI003C7781DC